MPFTITPVISSALKEIEASRHITTALPMTLDVLISLREFTGLTLKNYTRKLVGHRLTKEQLIVRNYYRAKRYVDSLVKQTHPTIFEESIRTIHGFVIHGKNRSIHYRNSQNLIKDNANGATMYTPPKASDVPQLMHDMVGWVNTERAKGELPIPIIAAIAHYQLLTIHPYHDGNGRTARLLTSLILHRSGYGLKGIYSLEEYYARNIYHYYDALTVADSDNYYTGRGSPEADLTKWIEYFCVGMADSFRAVRKKSCWIFIIFCCIWVCRVYLLISV